MNFENSMKEGYVKIVLKNIIRSKSLTKSSKQAIDTARKISLDETTSKTIFRELYEGLREFCEAIGYEKGYKFLSHESITYFLSDILDERDISKIFERYRKLRNGINYYGEDINILTVKEAIRNIQSIIKRLGKHMQV